ncbi:phage tail tape measure protein [Gilliamella sp. WF3-4]|uniref:phage tail tape measure protein n=1 Tax=Gilliamella sp. WF3-4 TaxID=3120255 RepID=UPI00080E3AFB|nr:phage tail tape measure protein [Gilliamella apicola]OCG19624.1 phage tail tape measure protein [Gilliamella apicola]
MSSSLDFVIKLTDRVTKPLKKVQSQIKAFNATAAGSLKKIGGGGIALFAVAKSITGLLSPAEEMDRALKNASIGGVSSINELRTAAKKFSAEYGTSAIDFVNSASSIKGALSGISDADVPQAVAAMNMLSTATGESVDTSTAYIEQMAASYKGTVNKIGQLNFARHAAGIAAYAKNNFNVSTQQLQSMMQKTKGTAANNGVSMAEQSVVLGMASKSLGAGAAGSYAALYKNLGKAGKELGLSFADANGKMLSMPEIIAKIQGKFGKDLSKNIKAQELLDKAFGAGADIVKTLANNSDELNQHVKEIGKGQNFKLMQKMAQGNVKPLERINAQFMNIKESIGRALLPVFEPIMKAVGGIIGKFAKWLEMFPNIAKWIGIVTVALISLAGIAAVFAIISGVISLLLSPITLIIIGIAAVIAVCWVFRKQIGNAIDWVIEKVKLLWAAFSETWVFKMIAGSLRFIGKVFLLLWKVVKFGIGVWVSLFVWLKDIIVSAISTVWECIKNSLFIQIWIDAFNLLSDVVCGVFELIGDIFLSTIDSLNDGWGNFIAFFTDFSFIDSFSKIGESLVKMFTNTWKTVKNMGIAVINTIIDGLNYIPGVNIELLEYEKIDAPEQSPVSTAKSPITSTLVRDIDHGGLSKEIQNSKSQNIDNSKAIQSVSIYNSQPMTPAQLQEWEQLYAG